MTHRSRCLVLAAALALPPAASAKVSEVSDTPSVIFHFAGFADVTYSDTQGEAGATGVVTVTPIVHVQVGDRFLVEAEMELEADDRGDQESGFEYATVNWLLTDSAALVIGKFLSPAGYYFQNLHPSWINKLASAPAGFGHGGAAPLTDVGLQLRGGRMLGNGHQLNYTAYVANGPRLGLEGMEGLDLNVEGSLSNRDGERVWGTRVGWLPTARLEVGALSAGIQ